MWHVHPHRIFQANVLTLPSDPNTIFYFGEPHWISWEVWELPLKNLCTARSAQMCPSRRHRSHLEACQKRGHPGPPPRARKHPLRSSAASRSSPTHTAQGVKPWSASRFVAFSFLFCFCGWSSGPSSRIWSFGSYCSDKEKRKNRKKCKRLNWIYWG